MSNEPEGGAIATIEKTPEVITTPVEYRQSLALWASKNYHVLSPFSNLSGLAPQHGIMTSIIKIDTAKEAGEVYSGLPFLKGSGAQQEVALAKVGLRKLAECAGISTTTNRTDPRNIQNYWEFKAMVSYRGVDGSVITREATKEWDLRDGSPQMKGWTQNQIEEGRKHGLRNCEARAINAAIREAGCGIKQKYTMQELAKPFVVLRVAFRADMNDPDQKRMVLERALGSTAQLYPASQPSSHGQAYAGGDDDEQPQPQQSSEPKRVGSGSTQANGQPPAQQQSTTPSQPQSQSNTASPGEGALKVTKITPRSGTTRNKPWTKWDIEFSDGNTRSTFSATHNEMAQSALDAGTWVEISDEQKGEYLNLTEIAPYGQQPSLPGTEDGGY